MIRLFKKCGCGLAFTLLEWQSLRLLGLQRSDGPDGSFAAELRNCPGCRSTLAIEHRTDNVELLIEGSRTTLESFIEANEADLHTLETVLRLAPGETGCFGGGAAPIIWVTRMPPEVGPDADPREDDWREITEDGA